MGLLHALGDQFPGVAATFLYVLVRLSVLDPVDDSDWVPLGGVGHQKFLSCSWPGSIPRPSFYEQVASRVSYSWSRGQL